MNTLRKYGAKYNVTFCTFAGLSTDTKPVGTTLIDNKSVTLANGSEFIEMDTNKKYLYDAESQTWNLADSGGGGGSATLIEKSITENGEYNASDDNADGYSKVTVDVAGGGGETFEVDMTFTVDSLQNPSTVSYTSTKRFSEVINAIDSSKKVDFTINVTDGTESVNLPLYGYVKYIANDIVAIFISTYEETRPDKPTFIAWAGDNTTPFLNGYTATGIVIPPAN